MDVIETKIDTKSDEYLKNYEAMESLVVNLKEELRIARDDRSPAARNRNAGFIGVFPGPRSRSLGHPYGSISR